MIIHFSMKCVEDITGGGSRGQTLSCYVVLHSVRRAFYRFYLSRALYRSSSTARGPCIGRVLPLKGPVYCATEGPCIYLYIIIYKYMVLVWYNTIILYLYIIIYKYMVLVWYNTIILYLYIIIYKYMVLV